MRNKLNIKIIVIAALIGLSLLIYFFVLNKKEDAVASEIVAKIVSAHQLDEQVKLYRQLIEKIGPGRAQEELLHSGLPFTGQTHLLNHTVGDYLYEEYGPAGLVKCKDYFLSSCYHGFVLRTIAKGGMAEVTKSFDECRKGGQTVMSQCSHAVGHGFLANIGYKNLPEALKTCDEAIQNISGFPAFNCYDGVFMENIWAVHEDGSPSPDRWVKKSDPFYPCSDPKIDKKYQLGCWSNQPALMYQLFDRDIKRVGQECHRVSDPENKKMCFNGLSRQIHPLTAGKIELTFKLCSLLPTEWNNYCVVVNAQSYFGVGDRELPFSVCNSVDESAKDECYRSIIGSIGAYGEDRQKLCPKIEDKEWRETCLNN